MQLGPQSDEIFRIREPRLELPNVSCVICTFCLEDTNFGAEFLELLIVLSALLEEEIGQCVLFRVDGVTYYMVAKG